MGSLRDDLAATADEVRETHISWVFLVGDDVFKVKKPVDLGFLDFSEPDLRRAACEAEVELNSRLSPEVYRGVVPVQRRGGEHRFGPVLPPGREPSSDTVDFAVWMLRLRDEDRADVILDRGELKIEDVDRMAVRIAEFHREARADDETARFGTPEAIVVNVRENFEQTRGALGQVLKQRTADAIERWQLDFLREHREAFLDRVRAGQVRDGHGDLRLEHFYLEPHELPPERRGSLRVLDCIEFNERFRYADVCADIAFLSMDLAWRGRVDLAERVLSTYARETSEFDLYPLVDFYESYRAYVRAKVSVMLAADEGAPKAVRERARQEARRYLLLALAMEKRPLLPPVLVAIGGVIASGKSTVADRLGAAMGAPAVNTDRIRKHLLGAQPTDRLHDGSWAGAYDRDFTERVYAEVRRAARLTIESGRPVILDASFRNARLRGDARRLASELGVPFHFIECRCDPELCRERLRERARRGPSVSDGRLEIFDDFLAEWEPVTELAPQEHVVIDTSRPLHETLAHLREHVPTWPEGL